MTIYCKKCGEKVEEDAKFCTNCGHIVTSKNIPNEGSIDKYFESKRSDLIVEAEKMAESEMLRGIVWFVLALLISGGSYFFTPEGETYYVLTGAIVYGVYRLIRGFWYKLNPESFIKKVENELDKK